LTATLWTKMTTECAHDHDLRSRRIASNSTCLAQTMPCAVRRATCFCCRSLLDPACRFQMLAIQALQAHHLTQLGNNYQRSSNGTRTKRRNKNTYRDQTRSKHLSRRNRMTRDKHIKERFNAARIFKAKQQRGEREHPRARLLAATDREKAANEVAVSHLEHRVLLPSVSPIKRSARRLLRASAESTE